MSGAVDVERKRHRDAADGDRTPEADKRIKLSVQPPHNTHHHRAQLTPDTHSQPANTSTAFSRVREAAKAGVSNGVGSLHSAAEDNGAASRPKKRRWDDALPQPSAPAATTETKQPPPPASAANATAALSQMELIKQKIAERARKLNIPVSINAPPSTTAAATAAAATATAAVKPELRQWAPLRLDELGRQVDESGQVVSVKREAELRVNQQPQQPDSKRAKYAKAKKEKSAEEDEAGKAYFDASLGGGGKRGGERQRRDMTFVVAGTHEREAALMRREILEREMEQVAMAETKEVDDEKRRQEEEERLAKEREEHIVVPTTYPTIPDIEWWDAAITTPHTPQPIASPSSSSPGITVKPASITSYIYHPKPTEALLPYILPPPKPIILTLRERKKLKRRAKLDKVKEQQQMQRQGLIPPPPPKLRLSNLMDVLVRESVAEPSEMERRVREEVRERQERHERTNKERELTTEQKKEKAKRKMRERTAAEGGLIGTLVAVYAVRRGLASRRVRYLLDVNTAQCNLNGLAVMVRQSGEGAASGGSEDERNGVSVVVVEGGPKGHRRFRRLLLHRIDWKRESERIDGQDDSMDTADNSSDDSDDDEPLLAGEGNSRECVCVWRGVVVKGVFVGFKLEVCRSALQGRKVFGKAGVEQYWDVARAVQFVKPTDAVE